MMIVFDFEVFQYDWLFVGLNLETKKYTVIENDRDKLIEFYKNNLKSIWIGYNCKNYDTYIFKAILLGINPKIVNDWIIKEAKAGWQFTNKFKDIELNIYDCMVFGKSLKQLESYLGVNIHETDVDFDIKRPLTVEEKQLNREYCRDDVYNTALVFQHTQDDFKAHLGLIKLAKGTLSDLSKTKAQLSAKILKAKPLPQSILKEEWQFKYNDCVKKYDYKHKDVLDFFDSIRETKDPKSKYETELYGVPHVFALGGLHGGVANYIKYPHKENRCIVHADVRQLLS